MTRCRLSISNDNDALVKHLAEYTWNARVERIAEDVPWSEAGATWQSLFREYAVSVVQALKGYGSPTSQPHAAARYGSDAVLVDTRSRRAVQVRNRYFR